MLIIVAALVLVCALLACMVAYMIFKASQSQQSHKAQLLAIQKRLAEKQANPDSPRPAPASEREASASMRNSQLDQIVGRLRGRS